MITGVGSSTGRGIATRFARDCACVIVCDPDAAGVNETARLITDTIMADLIERIPLNRMAEPAEIAAVHAFLASNGPATSPGK